MGPRFQEIMRGVAYRTLMLVDIGLMVISFGLAAFLSTNGRGATTIAEFFSSRVSLSSCVWFVVAVVICHCILSMCNLYESKRMSTKRAEAADVLRALTLSAVCLWGGSKLFGVMGAAGNSVFVAFWAIAVVLLTATRLLLRQVLGGIRKRGRNLHHILILGTNPRAVAFAQRIEAVPERGYRLLGFVDDDWSGIPEFKASGFHIACHQEGLQEFLRKNVVDELAIYLPLRSFYGRAAEIAKLAKEHGILIRLDTDIFDLKFSHQHAEASDGVRQQIVSSSRGIDGWPLLLKRILDFVASLALVILLCPLFLLVAALIKLTSPGPVLFAQKRVGLNKRVFTMYKFRTMVPAAESLQEGLSHLNEMSGPVFKIKNDPRVTPLGRILRRSSIDELPQLFNVLKGDMSLVGPRAMSVRDYQFFSEDWQRRRFSVPPGITCLWQIYGRNTIPFEQWMMLDMQYIDGWSLWLDLKILALTIPAVWKGLGAG